ncbi:MAG: oligosaccharide flippase family protein [Planctomycetes bacterium]|nr:oligosaccharide flippase family protein [Planctomycetota bacterium]MBI3843453.1 oligosaccharide flippase family protein [Planctomycetota bacterium]
MSARRRILRGGLELAGGHVLTQAFSFVRNVIVARLIGPPDFGVATLFATTYLLIDMISNLAIDAFLVQAEDGDEPHFVDTAHAMQAIRGVVNAALTFVLAAPVTSLLAVPDATWAFRWLAAIPLVRGFAHLDMFRLHRRMMFRPAIVVEVASSVVVTLAAWPLGALLRDYSAMVWILLAQAVTYVVASHLVAERRYGWSWVPSYARRSLAFGWPLLINGSLMFLIFQGDIFIIGSAGRLFDSSGYSLQEVGVYAAAFSLTLAPSVMIARVFSSLLLPILSRAQSTPATFERAYELCALTLSLVGGTLAIPFIVAGGWLMTRLFGADYAAAGLFIGLLASTQALRVIRVAPTLAAMARGDTQNSLVSNLARTTAFAGVLAVAAERGSLVWVAAFGVAGEALALVVCVARLRRQYGIRIAWCLKPALVAAAGIVAASALGAAGVAERHWVVAILLSLLLIALLVAGMLGVFPWFRRDCRAILLGASSEEILRKASHDELTAADSRPSIGDAGELRRSLLGNAIFRAYRFRRLRNVCMDLCLKLEGGPFRSATAREILAAYHGVHVGAYSYGECMVPGAFPSGVRIGRYVSIAAGVRVFVRNHPIDRLSTHPYFFNRQLGLVSEDTIESGTLEIGHDAWIGERAILTPGCKHVGIGAVIGAGAVVTKDVPEFAIVAGNPARLIRYRFPEETRDVIRASRWWERTVEDCARYLSTMTQALDESPWQHPLLAPPPASAATPVEHPTPGSAQTR